jgi:hypothetical protein
MFNVNKSNIVLNDKILSKINTENLNLKDLKKIITNEIKKDSNNLNNLRNISETPPLVKTNDNQINLPSIKNNLSGKKNKENVDNLIPKNTINNKKLDKKIFENYKISSIVKEKNDLNNYYLIKIEKTDSNEIEKKKNINGNEKLENDKLGIDIKSEIKNKFINNFQRKKFSL